MARIPTADISLVYSYINKQSFAIFLLLLGPWAKHVEIKAGTTNGFRCNITERCVMQLFHIFSNANLGKKLCLVGCGSTQYPLHWAKTPSSLQLNKAQGPQQKFLPHK